MQAHHVGLAKELLGINLHVHCQHTDFSKCKTTTRMEASISKRTLLGHENAQSLVSSHGNANTLGRDSKN